MILFPFIVSHTGKEIYGVYLLAMSITGYLGVMDFGLTAATIKYVAEFSGSGAKERIKDILSASFSFYCVIGVLTASILITLTFFVTSLFKIDEASGVIMTRLFLIAATASPFVWMGRTFEGALQGFQSFGWLAFNNVSSLLLTAVSAYVIFTNHMEITYFLAISYSLVILRCLSAYLIVRYKLLKEGIIFPYFDKKVFNSIFSFSSFVFLSSVTGLVILNIHNIIIGVFLSAAAVTLFNVALTLQNGFRALNSLLTGPIFPAYAHLEGTGEFEKQNKLLIKGTKYLTFIFVPMVIITIIFADPLVKYWMGDGFSESVLPAQVLIAFWLFNSILDCGSSALTAKGYVKIIFAIGLANAICNFCLSIVLIKYFGILGASLGITISMVFVNFPLFIYMILKVSKISIREFFDQSIRTNLSLYLIVVIFSLFTLKMFVPSNLLVVLFEMTALYFFTLATGYQFFLRRDEKNEILFMIRT